MYLYSIPELIRLLREFDEMPKSFETFWGIVIVSNPELRRELENRVQQLIAAKYAEEISETQS